MTVAAAAGTKEENVVRLGRVALVAQGILYAVVGLLAAQVARGDAGTEASQTGAIDAVARQPFGKGLLVVLTVGLVAHAGWRLLLTVRGEVGNDEDSGSLAKRAANFGRFVIYAGFIVAAVRLLTSPGEPESGSGGGETPKRGTAVVLGWPGGTWIVAGIGLVIIGVGVWNAKKAVTQSFEDDLDLSSLDEGPCHAVRTLGTVGYGARALVFALVGVFVVNAGRENDAQESSGLDDALGELAQTSQGPILLLILAVGMVLFGAYRILDGVFRKPSEISYS